MMDCFNHFCGFRQNETANPDNCDYLACKNRCEGIFAYSADSSGTLIADESIFNNDTSKIERIQELLKADKDGRLVILPCKMGDTVYYIRREFDGTDVVGEAELWWSDIPYIGKTIFLTREEAEKALEERK